MHPDGSPLRRHRAGAGLYGDCTEEDRGSGGVSPIAARRLPLFLADDEPERLLRATTRERDRILLLTGLYCGLRVSELCGLRVEDIDFRRRLLWVREGKGRKDRVVPIPKVLVGPLRGWVGSRATGFVFPSPRAGKELTPRAVQLLLKRLARRARLHRGSEPRRCTPHKLRHAYATRLLQTGADINEVKELLGHSSINTTAIYLHCSPDRLREAVDRLSE